MTASKHLPARPSLESLRKQAKKLARDVAAGDAAAIARARAHLPKADPLLSQRNAQLVIAREYGYAGWQDLTAEVSRRAGNGVEWAATQARRAIHDNDIARLTSLLDEFPALLSWEGEEGSGGLLGFATGAYGDAFDANRERNFTRAECAELLIDRGAVVLPSVFESLLQARARGLLQLFRRKGLLPPTLDFFAALGDLDAVRSALDENGRDSAAVNQAFMYAVSFEHETVAALLLERSVALDPELGARVDRSGGRVAFIRSLIENRSYHFAPAEPPWQVFIVQQAERAVHDGDPTAFLDVLRREPWLLGDAHLDVQVKLIGHATLRDRGELITALLDRDPALLRRQPPPRSQAIEFALTYAKTHLLPLLTRIWPLPDDLPHAAGVGDLTRVKQWFDDSGAPALGDLRHHYPHTDRRVEGDLHWGAPTVQQVLDVALAFAVINNHFDVADFLLAHGADVNTNWGSHEPASIMHELVGQVGTGENPPNYEAMRFLVDRGIDLTIEDYRWNATPAGWARYAARDENMAQWLEEAARQQHAQRKPQ